MGDIFYPYAITIDSVTASVLVDAVSEQGIEMGEEVLRPMGDGQLYPRTKFTGGTEDVIVLSTRSIAKALTKITLTGFKILAASPVVLFCQKAEHGGTRGGASKHLKIEIKAGVVVIGPLRAATEGAAATMGIAIHTAEDGTNAPLTFTKLQSLPADDLTAPEEFYAGPVKLNNVALEGVSEIVFDPGITLTKRRSSASAALGVDHISIARIAPTVGIVTDQVDIVSDYEKAVDIASATHFYLRKAAIGARVAAATAEHISFTMTDGAIKGRTIGGTPQIGALEILPIYDGTNAIVALDMASAIT